MVSASSISDDVYFSTLEQEQSAQFLHATVQNNPCLVHTHELPQFVLHPQNIKFMILGGQGDFVGRRSLPHQIIFTADELVTAI